MFSTTLPPKNFLKGCIQRLEERYLYASILIKGEESERICIRLKEEEITPSQKRPGAVITLWDGSHFHECAFNDLTEEAFNHKVDKLYSLRNEGFSADEKEAFYRKLFPTDAPIEEEAESFIVAEEIEWKSVPLQQKVAFARKQQEAFKNECDKDIRLIEMVLLLQYVRSCSLFVNRYRYFIQEIPRTEIIYQAIASKKKKNAQLHDGKSAQGGYEKIALSKKERKNFLNDLTKLLTAKRLSPGEYDVIFDPEFAGIFAHEAFGHGTEVDQFPKGRSKGAEYLNKQVASTLVDMYDSPNLPGISASYFFDDEGQRTSSTQIIEKGILKQGLTNAYSALKAALPRTANGRRESYARKAYARMSNTTFGTGENSFEEMLASIESGYLLRHPSNGMEDPKGWGIQLEGYMVEEIKNGKLTGKVYSPVIVTGFVPDLLNSISMVGKERFIKGLGFCGKGHKEWVKVTDGGPYLKLRAQLG